MVGTVRKFDEPVEKNRSGRWFRSATPFPLLPGAMPSARVRLSVARINITEHSGRALPSNQVGTCVTQR
jgi:hypothetical protein